LRSILVSNESTVVSDADAAAGVADVQDQINTDFAPAYSGLRADLVFWPKSKGSPPKNIEIIHILDNSDVADALGYHELNPAGYPEGFVFAKTTIDAGDPWETCFGHETLEQILDPYANWTVQAAMGQNVVWVALEDCDPCESDQYSPKGIPRTYFVLPLWFTGGAGQVDFLGKLKKGLSLDAGGYIAYADSSGQWGQVTGRQVHAHRAGAPKFSRKGRYALHTHHAMRGVSHTAKMDMNGWLQLLSSLLQIAPQLIQQVQQIVQTIGAALPAGAPARARLAAAK
jgi:hypothetical protein